MIAIDIATDEIDYRCLHFNNTLLHRIGDCYLTRDNEQESRYLVRRTGVIGHIGVYYSLLEAMAALQARAEGFDS